MTVRRGISPDTMRRIGGAVKAWETGRLNQEDPPEFDVGQPIATYFGVAAEDIPAMTGTLAGIGLVDIWGFTTQDAGGGIIAVDTGANPTITTADVHGLAAKQKIIIEGVKGADGANGVWKVLAVPTTTSFTITADAPGTYDSGGAVLLPVVASQDYQEIAVSFAGTVTGEGSFVAMSRDPQSGQLFIVAGGGAFSGDVIFNAGATNITTNVLTIPWTGSEGLSDGYWDADNPKEIIIPEPGIYRLDIQVALFTPTTNLASNLGLVTLNLIDSNDAMLASSTFNIDDFFALAQYSEGVQLSCMRRFDDADFVTVELRFISANAVPSNIHYGSHIRTGQETSPRGTFCSVQKLTGAVLSGVIGTDTIDGGTFT